MSREVPGVIDVVVATGGASALSLNGELHHPDPGGLRLERELPVDNAGSAVLTEIEAVGARPGEGGNGEDLLGIDRTTTFTPRDPEAFVHDADGNLLRDGRWNYEWNADNRLVRMTTRADLPAAVPRLELEFVYDHAGRRVSKVVRDGAGAVVTTLRFLYHGWNLVAELAGDGAPVRSYVWGLDLSGSLQGAGGVGGLQWAEDHRTGETLAPEYDGNGNIVRWTPLAGGSGPSADLDYAPFGGELISLRSRPTIPFGFSTKYRDAETGLLYYGYRYYNPATGRWLNRDPIGEQGGENLYSFVHNNLIGTWDLLGLRGNGHHLIPEATWKSVFGDSERSMNIWKQLLDAPEEARTGLNSKDHDYTGHNEYSRRVRDILEDFKKSEMGNNASRISSDRAREMLRRVKCSPDEYIRGFNSAVHQGGKINYWNGWRIVETI